MRASVPVVNDRLRPMRPLRAVVVSLGALVAACDLNIAGPNTIAPPAIGVFVGKVYPDGRTRWPFEMTSPGTLTLTLEKVDPPVRVGLAFGDFETPECMVKDESVTSAGASGTIVIAVDAGEKCIEVFDVGAVPLSGVSFSVTISAS